MTEIGSRLSDELAGAVERGGRSVVRVEGRRRGPSSGVVWSDGTVVTANHVLEWDEDVRVGLPSGEAVTATVAGRDPGTDLAVLRIEASGLQPASWADPDRLRVGHLVLALSRPGRSVRAGLGVVSAVGEAWRTRSGGRLDRYVQADVGLHPGVSGGLLVDAAGGGVGLGTAGLVRGTCLAVPAPTLRRVIEALLAHGHVRRGFLGIGSFPVPLPSPIRETLGQTGALLIVSVQPGSPASAAGLVLGDVLVSVEGQAVTQPGDLLPFLDPDRIGTELAIRLLRAGEVRDARLGIGERNGRSGAGAP
jgi:S1-C subfamily serine protease